MTSIFGFDKKEAVRISVKKCDGLKQPEYKKLCVDPQITSFDTLRQLLAKAFQVKNDFTISYVATDSRGQDIYLAMLSDWDLDAAFFSFSDPVLKLKVDLKPFEEGPDDDWDLLLQSEDSRKSSVGMTTTQIMQTQLFGVTIGNMTSQLKGTMSSMGKMMGMSSQKPLQDPHELNKKAMTDREFHDYMDNVGHMVRPQDFRLSVYQGGVEHSLRKVVWRHLLNVYPEGLSGQERFDYLKQKSSEYYRLRDEWRTPFLKKQSSDEIKAVTHMVKKDVLRTDRTFPFYAGSDDNKNTLSLFNLLTTYALTHPGVSYCQGMSDLASPILYVQNDEAHAYVCFCGLMKRLSPNFALDGDAMTLRFQHLSLLLRHHDPDFYGYLKEHKADDMFFCYRWLVLELKREFPFEQSLMMLEIMWSSLLPDPPKTDIKLADDIYFSQGLGRLPLSPASVSHGITPYVRLRHRRQQSEDQASLEPTQEPTASQVITPREDCIDTNFSDYLTLTTDDIDSDFGSLDLDELSDSNTEPTDKHEKSAEHNQSEEQIKDNCDKKPKHDANAIISTSALKSSQPHSKTPSSEAAKPAKSTLRSQHKPVPKGPGKARQCSGDTMPEFVENHYNVEIDDMANFTADSQEPLLSQSPKRPNKLDIAKPSAVQESSSLSPRISGTGLVIEENGVTERNIMNISSCEEAGKSLNYPSIGFINVDEKLSPLPQPQVFGNGNPFLMFLCLALFSLHRDHIIKNRMDYNDMAMFFDKMVRKHKVKQVLHQAQSMYASYLKQQQQIQSENKQADV